MSASDPLGRGRKLYANRRWSEAREALADADGVESLGPEDLGLLATAAYMLGDDAGFCRSLERAHQAHRERDEAQPAARCAFWIGLSLITRGEVSRATGWFGRAERLLAQQATETVEHGYLMIPRVIGRAGSGEYVAAAATAARAVEIAERFDERDLLALALHEQGNALIRLGRSTDGLAMLDQAMLEVTTDDLSPIVTGLVYCSVIAYCQEIFELGRAREWTAALSRWCEQQPEMIAHTGQCLVHRAELMQLSGAWEEALAEADRARDRLERSENSTAAAHASYRKGEIHRLRGEVADAEAAYRAASERGWEPQPGLALLRLAQGDAPAAAAAIRRALGEADEPFRRAALLPAAVEVMLALGDRDGAEGASLELERISATHASAALAASSAQVRGVVALSSGDAEAALAPLRAAARGWLELEAIYEVARARALLGLACRALGDEDTASLELEAARRAFAKLEAAPDLAVVESLSEAGPRPAHGLSPRELEVLRLVAAGNTNKSIAVELVVSERTVDRHVSNIFAKLGVSSRAAATALAYERRLL